MTRAASETNDIGLRGSRGAPKWFLYFDPAPEEITNQAQCGPEDAWLFDAQTDAEMSREGAHFVRSRIQAAQGICEFCPVKVDCLFYGLENRLAGVYGGELITESMIVRMEQSSARRLAADRRVDEDSRGRGQERLVTDHATRGDHGDRGEDAQGHDRVPTELSAA